MEPARVAVISWVIVMALAALVIEFVLGVVVLGGVVLGAIVGTAVYGLTSLLKRLFK